MRPFIPALLLLVATATGAAAQQSDVGAAFHEERQDFVNSCSSFTLRKVVSCAQVVASGTPVHVSFGSVAPQAGIGVGGAFAYPHNVGERWRLDFNADAVRTFDGSWRAGGYLKAVLIPPRRIVPVEHPTAISPTALGVRPEFNVYVQSASIVELPYYGIGPSTADAGRAVFGTTNHIFGGNAAVPLLGASGLSMFGELNGRQVSARERQGADDPSIGQLYSPTTAPGLGQTIGYLQSGEGLRFNRNLAGLLTFRYAATLQQFTAVSLDGFSFRRATLDLTHEIALYRGRSGPAGRVSATDIAGPNESPASLRDYGLRNTRDRTGAIELSAIMVTSYTNDTAVVPFYLQPTIGGMDLNGTLRLPSYDDYRFRAPNMLLLRATIEHSLAGPVGVIAGADAGRVAERAGDLGLSDLRHSYMAGLTIRAGGFPQFMFVYAWDGGSHTIAHLSSTVLGGGARPSLY